MYQSDRWQEWIDYKGGLSKATGSVIAALWGVDVFLGVVFFASVAFIGV